jgi:hypothetical protein
LLNPCPSFKHGSGGFGRLALFGWRFRQRGKLVYLTNRARKYCRAILSNHQGAGISTSLHK